MLIVYIAFIFMLINSSSEFSLWNSANEPEDVKPIKRDPPKSCPHFDIVQVPENYQGNMGDLWIVTHIVPKGKSQYADGSSACGLYNFMPNECKCLRYSISLDENESMIRKTIGLEVKSRMFRYIESRIVFVEDDFDVFQAQFLMSASINFEGTKSTLTKSPNEEEIYPEYQSYALLATDNYETYAVYASCVPFASGPIAWTAISDAAFTKGIGDEISLKIQEVLTKNGIDYRKMVPVDQHNCRPKT